MDERIWTREQAQPEIAARLCFQDACLPAVPSEGMDGSVAAHCKLTIGYAPAAPDMPWLRFEDGACAMNAEIAIAVALAAFLKMTAAATPVVKGTPH